MHINGQCFCGGIRYEAELDEQAVGICHCRDCQLFSGAPFRTSGFVEPGAFRFTAGEPIYLDKIADSGKTCRMALCGECGSHLCSLPGSDEPGAFVSIRVATADQFSELRPVFEVFCRSRTSWLEPISGAVQFEAMLERP